MTRSFLPSAKSLLISLFLLAAGAPVASAQIACPQPPSAGPVVVDQNHIFCGEISGAGIAGGFHSRPGGLNPVTGPLPGVARIGIIPAAGPPPGGTTINPPPPIPGAPVGVYKINNFNIIVGGAVALKALSTMFPDACTQANVVAAIQNAVAAGGFVGPNFVGPSGAACMAVPAAGGPPAPFNIRVVFNAAGQVRTAFPNY